MGGALEWISEIANWVGQFFPRWVIIDTRHGGVKFIRGHKVVTLGSGWHPYWPLTTILDTYPTARQAANLTTQTITTKGTDACRAQTIAVGGMIVYDVYDVEKILAHTFEPDRAIQDMALSAIHDVCCQLTWDELMEQQRNGVLDKALKAEVKKSLDPFGVRVLKTMLTDLAQCRVYKVIQSTSSDRE